jgi:hypothetical protein
MGNAGCRTAGGIRWTGGTAAATPADCHAGGLDTAARRGHPGNLTFHSLGSARGANDEATAGDPPATAQDWSEDVAPATVPPGLPSPGLARGRR